MSYQPKPSGEEVIGDTEAGFSDMMYDQPKPTKGYKHTTHFEQQYTQPKPTGEWTVEKSNEGAVWIKENGRAIAVLCAEQDDSEAAKAIAYAHNAALDKANVRETELICERDYFKKELAVEREKIQKKAEQ